MQNTPLKTLPIVDQKKMRTAGKRICSDFEPFLAQKRHRLSDYILDKPIVFISTGRKDAKPSMEEKMVEFDREISDGDWANDFLKACRIISRGDTNAGLFLIYKYYCGLDDRDIADRMYVSLKYLSKVKTSAYVQIAYLAGKRYALSADDDE